MSPKSSLSVRALEGGVRFPRTRNEAPARPTIKAVAEHASVAISTVSRVVNGGPASETVRQRVLASIAELGYTPSVAAQSLVSRRAGCIGLAVNYTQSPWFSQILSGIEEALLPTRMSVLLASMMLSGEYDPSAVLGWIQERRVDGLILVRYSARDQHLLDAATAAHLPVVLFAPDVTAPVDFLVRCDNREAGRAVATHLLELGHTRIAFAGGPESSIDTLERLRGLAEVLAGNEATTADGQQALRAPHDTWFGSGYSPDYGAQYAERFLGMPREQRPSAVVLGNDQMAIGFMRRVLQGGVSIPGEVSVVGFDGTPDGAQFWPGLTTVSQPTRDMSARACGALLASILGTETEQDSWLEYGADLVVRESTGPVPTGR